MSDSTQTKFFMVKKGQFLPDFEKWDRVGIVTKFTWYYRLYYLLKQGLHSIMLQLDLYRYLITILMKKKFSERRIYLNPDNCDDCVLKQLEQADLDTCGGRKVADGSEEDGTMYRYIASGIFIYFWLNFHFRFKVFSHTIFNATVVTFRSHKDDQTVVIGQPSE